MENREKFSSRLGFLLISAGCAIGLGNVWKFPYITGKYGGAAFVLIYFVFLLILGIPILTLELAVGRASQRSVALSMDVLEPKGTKWHWFKFPAMAGNYILMMFYTTVAGWMVYYFFKMAAGGFVGMNADEIGATFNSTLANPTLNVAFMIAVVISCMLIVGKGLQNGVEKITKVMMIALLVLSFRVWSMMRPPPLLLPEVVPMPEFPIMHIESIGVARLKSRITSLMRRLSARSRSPSAPSP